MGVSMTGHVITVAQQKGGSGKTTIAIHLAVAFSSAGKSVALLDTDPQGSLGRWFMERHSSSDGAPGLEFGTASAWGVTYECEKLAKSHDIVIVDTPPKIDADLRPALRIADLVLIPVTTSQMDVWALENIRELAEREDCATLVVLNRVPPRARLTSEIVEQIDGTGLERATHHLGNRVAYAAAMGQGKSATEGARSQTARTEISALATEISERLEALAESA